MQSSLFVNSELRYGTCVGRFVVSGIVALLQRAGSSAVAISRVDVCDRTRERVECRDPPDCSDGPVERLYLGMRRLHPCW